MAEKEGKLHVCFGDRRENCSEARRKRSYGGDDPRVTPCRRQGGREQPQKYARSSDKKGNGGQIVCQGSVEEIKACEGSITGQYLSGKRAVPVPEKRRKGNGKYIEIRGAAENNLKNMHVPRTKKEKEEIKKWETEHPGEEYPREWNVSIEAFVSDDDDDSTADRDPALIDHKASEFYEPYSSAATERLWESIHELPPRQKKALRLTWFIGYSQAETAAIMHCSKANICKLNKSAFERIRTDEKLVGILFRRG